MGEWFKDWFASDEYLNVYSHRNKKDADSLLKLILTNISIPPNASILDSACGNGRHSESLSKLGYNVFGFDLSKTLLQIAQKNKLANNSAVKYFCSDIRNIPINKPFDVILNLFTSFGYFNRVEENLVKSSEKILGAKKIVEQRKIKEGRVEKEILIKDDKFSHRYFESVQLYSIQEILTMFKHFGFNPINKFGNFSGDVFDENNSERMIIIFKK